MTDIPDSHPRAASLRRRERLVQGLRNGITSEAGLIAHGRGEAFDYLLGEKTGAFAVDAIRMASASILRARHPAFSVNGNVAALAGPELVALFGAIPELAVEVNLFHFSLDRVQRIQSHLHALGAEGVLGSGIGETLDLPDLDSARRKMHADGIGRADLVIVPLEGRRPL